MKLLPYVIVASLATESSIAAAQDAPRRSDPFYGPIKVAVSEPVMLGARPRMFLELETANHYSCSNLEIDARLQRSNDTISVTLHGLVPDNLCSPAFGPAHKVIPLGLSPGTYLLMISYENQMDRLQLFVSSTRLDLHSLGPTRFMQPDTASFWRPHPRSFLLSCGTPNVPELCADLAGWLERQSGIIRKPLPSTARIGFGRYAGTWHSDYRLYEYDDEALERVRRCIGHVAAAVAEAVGVSINLQTAAGEIIKAWSKRANHEKHIDTPRRVIDGVSCPN